MLFEVSRGDFRVSILDCLDEGLVDEDVLLLRLYHEVPLTAQTGHVTVNIYGAQVFDSVQHGVDDDVDARPATSGADRMVGWLIK